MSIRIPVDLKSNIIIHRHVCNFEHTLEVLNHRVKVLFIWSANDPVINKDPNNEVNKVGGSEMVINARVNIISNEVIKLKESVKGMIPR